MTGYQKDKFLELPLKERQAIELRYLGNQAKEISKRVDTPLDTINGWFEENGKLFSVYKNFESYMNEERQAKLLEKLTETDANIFRMTTLLMRKFGKRLNDDKKYKPKTQDFKIAWEIQRVMQGLPTDVKRQDMTFNQEELDAEAELIRKMVTDKKPKDE